MQVSVEPQRFRLRCARDHRAQEPITSGTQAVFRGDDNCAFRRRVAAASNASADNVSSVRLVALCRMGAIVVVDRERDIGGDLWSSGGRLTLLLEQTRS
jgi:hypothetical protein